MHAVWFPTQSGFRTGEERQGGWPILPQVLSRWNLAKGRRHCKMSTPTCWFRFFACPTLPAFGRVGAGGQSFSCDSPMRSFCFMFFGCPTLPAFGRVGVLTSFPEKSDSLASRKPPGIGHPQLQPRPKGQATCHNYHSSFLGVFDNYTHIRIII